MTVEEEMVRERLRYYMGVPQGKAIRAGRLKRKSFDALMERRCCRGWPISSNKRDLPRCWSADDL
jgi:hypothetical protein